jgi:hypothetical protein
MSPLIKNVGLAFALAVVLWLGYILFLKDDSPVLTEDPTLTAAIQDGQEFLARIQELDQMQLDGTILHDVRFESLTDFTLEPTSEEVGRDNPFAPISVQ